MLVNFRPPRLRRSLVPFLYGGHGHFTVDTDKITYTAERLNSPATLHLRRYDYSDPESMEIEIPDFFGNIYKATIFPTNFGDLGMPIEGVLKSGRKGYEMRSSQKKHREIMLKNAAFLLGSPELREDLQKALKDGTVKSIWLGPKTMKYLKFEDPEPKE